MEFKTIADIDEAHEIFVFASTTTDFNSKNYTSEQFYKSWPKWIDFSVMFEDGEPVLFCGIRNYGDFARIFDRYFVFPDKRLRNLSNNEYCRLIVADQISKAKEKIPFFSMEFLKRRPVLQNAIDACNEVLPEEHHFHLLPGLYETAPNSWQNVALQKPHTWISLNYKKIS